MSVIQSIQEKYAKLMAIIIAVALMIFVVMLAFENGGSLFRGGNTSTVGRVNGRTIEYNDFMRKVDEQEKTMEQRGYGSGASLQQQAIEAVWNDEINQIIQNSELDKVGLRVGKKEMGDVLYGPNGPEDLKKIFTDSATGQYNGQLAKQQIDAILRVKKGTPDKIEQRNQIISFINYQEKTRLRDKYNALLNNSINYPKWFIEKQIADNSQLAKIGLVRKNYAEVSDSTIKVTDKEIQDYLEKHKKDYKQQMQESRSISYVAISTLPSAADSASAREKVLALKAEFDTTTNAESFIKGAGSEAAPVYAGKSLMQMVNKDTLQKLPVGAVYGPYLDGASYLLAKMLDIKQMPDSVKCRHILLATTDRSGQPLMDDSVAHKKVDSIALAIKNGANFDSMETKFSTDQAAHKDKGVMTFSSAQIQSENFAKEFAQFILFDGKPGDKKVVHTQFGWHYIEILSFIKPEPHYKIAYISKPIEASPETENNAANIAAQFAGDSRDKKSFDANAEKLAKQKGVTKNIAAEIIPSSYQITGLGISRPLVKSIYKADLGDVLEPEKVGENWVVAIVTEINEEGSMPAAKARLTIEPTLRNKKIAEKLIKQVGTVTTLEAAATALGGKPIESIDSLRMSEQTGMAAKAISSEPKVIGASFNPSNRGKVVPQVLEGRSAVYVLRVDNVTATAVSDANVAEQRKNKYQMDKSMSVYRSNPIQILRDAASIKDRRMNFF